MACGCPVVASKTGALPEIGGDAAVYCDPYDPASIGDAIRSLVTDDAMRQQYAARALQPSQAVRLGQVRAADARGPGGRGDV